MDHEEALYASLVSFYTSLKPPEVDRLNMFERTDARQALKQLGARFISRYPRSAHVPEVKLNIARAFYEDGEYAESAKGYREFALQYPSHADAVTAAQLALSSLRELNDLKGLEDTALVFAKSKLPDAFRAEVQHNLKDLPAELPDLPEGDVFEGLLKIAADNAGTPRGESALANAYKLQRDKRDFPKAEALVRRLVQEYPNPRRRGMPSSSWRVTPPRSAATTMRRARTSRPPGA
jgi:outer membrane protein assembly factor BamD (BamD/ComL family)